LVRRSQRPARRERPSEQRQRSSKKPDGTHMYMRRRFTCHVPAPFVTMESWTHIFCSRRMRLPHVYMKFRSMPPGKATTCSGQLGIRSCVCAGNVGLSKCSVRRTAGPLPHSTPHSAKFRARFWCSLPKLRVRRVALQYNFCTLHLSVTIVVGALVEVGWLSGR